MKKIFKAFLLMAVLCMVLVGCDNKSTSSSYEAKDGEIAVYYTGADGYSLTAFYEEQGDKSVKECIDRVLYLLAYPPSGYNKVITSEAQITDYTYEDGKITLLCPISYAQFGTVGEILWRAAVVKSLVSIPEVESVAIEIAGQPLVDSSGKVIGFMDEDSFENTLNHKLGETTINCYYTDISGKWLLEERRMIQYPVDEPTAYYVVKALIDGPEENGHYPVISDKTVIQNVSISDGVCYLHLSQSFLNDPLDVSAEVSVYAIVNTLSELPEISRVHFVIEGVENPVYKNTVSLAKALSAKLELIKRD